MILMIDLIIYTLIRILTRYTSFEFKETPVHFRFDLIISLNLLVLGFNRCLNLLINLIKLRGELYILNLSIDLLQFLVRFFRKLILFFWIIRRRQLSDIKTLHAKIIFGVFYHFIILIEWIFLFDFLKVIRSWILLPAAVVARRQSLFDCKL